MSYKLFLLFGLSILVGCSGGGGASSASSSPWNSYWVASASDLPSCSGDIVGRLYYVEGDDNFQVCKTTGWAVVNIQGSDGADGAPGTTVSSIKNISGSSTDFCTQYTGESCFFGGGQLLSFSDGSFFVSGNWSNWNIVTGDTDIDTIQKSGFGPASWSNLQLSLFVVARGSGYKTAYLVYTRSPESVKIYLDSNEDGSIGGSDELLYTATLTSL